MDHLPKDDFVSSCIGHWENTGSPSYADLLNVYTFHCNTLKKKITFDIITNLVRKFKYRETVKFTVVDMSFLKF